MSRETYSYRYVKIMRSLLCNIHPSPWPGPKILRHADLHGGGRGRGAPCWYIHLQVGLQSVQYRWEGSGSHYFRLCLLSTRGGGEPASWHALPMECASRSSNNQGWLNETSGGGKGGGQLTKYSKSIRWKLWVLAINLGSSTFRRKYTSQLNCGGGDNGGEVGRTTGPRRGGGNTTGWDKEKEGGGQFTSGVDIAPLLGEEITSKH